MEPDISNENPNNFYWKNKLEDAESLSTETLRDKNATWEKLHSRLHQKVRRKRVVWYWAAAACLLPAILIVLILVNKNESNIVKNSLPNREITKPELPEAQPLKEDMAITISAAPGDKKRTVKRIIKNKNNNTITDSDEKTLAINMNQIAANKIISSVPVIDSLPVTTVAIAPAKKKLKVVHINELGYPVAEPLEIARNTNPHSVQLKFANQEVYINPSFHSVNPGFTFFKRKALPQN